MAKNKQSALPPEGWYPDDSGTMRWWDGAQWTPWRDGTTSPLSPRTPPPDPADLATPPPSGGIRPIVTAVAALVSLGLGLFLGLATAGRGDGDTDRLEKQLAAARSDVAAVETELEEASARADQAEGRIETLEKREKQVGILDGRVLLGDGTYVVGDTVDAGTYRTIANSGCTWQRSSTEDGGPSARLAGGTINGADVVTILASDASFTTEKCNLWFRID